MPFVYVHGVNTRKGDDYEREEKVRNAFLKEYVAPRVRIEPTHKVFSPYWGSDGVAFWKNKIFGFTESGQFVTIDPTTGAGTLVQSNGPHWWGAAVTTSAPVIF